MKNSHFFSTTVTANISVQWSSLGMDKWIAVFSIDGYHIDRNALLVNISNDKAREYSKDHLEISSGWYYYFDEEEYLHEFVDSGNRDFDYFFKKTINDKLAELRNS